MNRAIVLILCLAAAAGILAYSRDKGDQTAVFTVPQRTVEPAAQPPVPPPQRAIETPGDRASLARELQRELKRVGCYSGDINGVWTTSSRMAMKAFTDRVNATLPIDNPDYILLSLVQARQDKACDASCPAGQAANDSGRCTPNAVLAKAASNPAPGETKAEPSTEKSTTTVGSGVPTAAAAATALAAAAAVPKAEPRAFVPDDRARPAAVAPRPEDTPDKAARPERSTRRGGPVPPAGVYERRSRRYATSRPPKFVRNFFRTLGFR